MIQIFIKDVVLGEPEQKNEKIMGLTGDEVAITIGVKRTNAIGESYGDFIYFPKDKEEIEKLAAALLEYAKQL